MAGRLFPEDLAARRRVLALLRTSGWNATSFQVLEPDFRYSFFGDACVAWVPAGRARVAAGAPLARPEELAAVARSFIAEARSEGRRAAFFAIEPRLLEALPLASIPIGVQPWWNPQRWDRVRREHRSIREQTRRARAKGVRVERADPALLHDGRPLRAELEELIRRWIAARRMPLMAFLVDVQPFLFAEERRFYVARYEERVVGLLVAVPVYLRDGWLFEDLLRAEDAPNGTAETLVDLAMRDVAAEGCGYATLGLVPLGGDAWWHRAARRLLAPFYGFEGLRRFKAKLRPDGWDPIFLAHPETTPAAVALYDALSAFARGRPFRFAASALARMPRLVLLPVGAAFVPWILLLALASDRWFPSRGVKVAWIAFDALLALALIRIGRRWSLPLAKRVLAAASLDAVASGVQAAAFNARRARGALDLAVIVFAAAAPLALASFLAAAIRASGRED